MPRPRLLVRKRGRRGSRCVNWFFVFLFEKMEGGE